MTIYCVYITFYSGNQLPPFYIGYTSVDKINKGYHGSIQSKKYKSIWLSELKNNPHLFKTIIFSEHSSKEDAKEREEYIQRYFNVHKNLMYINLNISGKNFCPPKGHKPMLGKKHTEDSKKKMSKNKKGIVFSETHKQNISKNCRKYQTPETREKIRIAGLGRKWSPETLKKMSDSARKRLPNTKEYIIITPQNEEISIKNLAKFCRENNLLAANMHHILRGLQKHHRGYSIRRS